MRLRNRGKNRWQLRWELGRDDQGHRRQRTETFHGNKKSAEQRWREVQATIEGQPGDAWATEELTFAAYLERWWVYAAQDLRPSTQASYQSHIRRYLVPQLGSLKLTQITALHVEEALQQWRTQPRQDGKSGVLASRTVSYLRMITFRALEQAVLWDLLTANPARRVKGPTVERPTIQWWTPEEAQQFLRISDQHRLGVAFRLALFGGLRLGEVLGLRWQDVDWTAKTITIAQVASRAGSSVPHLGPPKTAKSRRIIQIGSPHGDKTVDHQLLEPLKARYHAQKLERLACGGEATDLIVTTMKGRIILPRNLETLLDRLIVHAGVKRIRFHDLRHTHATWLAQAGVNPKVIADRLGHSQVAFTLQMYVHSDLADQAQAISRLAPFGPH